MDAGWGAVSPVETGVHLPLYPSGWTPIRPGRRPGLALPGRDVADGVGGVHQLCGAAAGGASSVWRKTSLPLDLWSSATSVLAAESKATSPPPAAMLGLKLSPSPWVPSSATLTRVTVGP